MHLKEEKRYTSFGRIKNNKQAPVVLGVINSVKNDWQLLITTE